MSAPYKVTLLQLKPGATALGEANDKLELGVLAPSEIYQLAAALLQVKIGANPNAQPAIIVQQGDKGWRIAVKAGRLCMHKSTSLYDEYWSVENAAGLAELPPFNLGAATPTAQTAPKSGRRAATQPGRYQTLRSVGEVAGLFVLAAALIVVGFKFGLPQRRLSDLPADIEVVSGDQERAAIFSLVAGSYATGKKPGDSYVTITPQGRALRGRIGKDGKPAAPEMEEAAKAARKGKLSVVVTSFGLIAEVPPDAVNVGTYRWRKLVN